VGGAVGFFGFGGEGVTAAKRFGRGICDGLAGPRNQKLRQRQRQKPRSGNMGRLGQLRLWRDKIRTLDGEGCASHLARLRQNQNIHPSREEWGARKGYGRRTEET
jgi:hypothetical protein